MEGAFDKNGNIIEVHSSLAALFDDDDDIIQESESDKKKSEENLQLILHDLAVELFIKNYTIIPFHEENIFSASNVSETEISAYRKQNSLDVKLIETELFSKFLNQVHASFNRYVDEQGVEFGIKITFVLLSLIAQDSNQKKQGDFTTPKVQVALILEHILDFMVIIVDDCFRFLATHWKDTNKEGIEEITVLLKNKLESLQKALLPENMLDFSKSIYFGTYKISFDKELSDSYVQGMIGMLGSKLLQHNKNYKYWLNELSVDDRRIDTGLQPSEIEAYFEVLLEKCHEENRPYISKKDLDFFLCHTFRGFGPAEENRVLIKASSIRHGNIFKYRLKEFATHIDLIRETGKKEKYAQSLIDCFSMFNNRKVNSLTLKMSPEPDRYPFT
jgi:hypothetical protein